MANDFKGAPKEFAMVVPVPSVLEEGQIHVGDKAILDHLDRFTAPRLVEYHDPDPCARADREELAFRMMEAPQSATKMSVARDAVTVEASYTVGEYDIVILSARESDGLERWLHENGYSVPRGASRILAGYLKQDMKFFVAKVNLAEQQKLGFQYLRPLQIAFESPKFVLPIRLGMVNADGPQELFIYTLTKNGRVETTNYRNVKLPTGMDIPTYIKAEFGDFYRSMFDHQVKRHGMQAVFTEYAWDMGWCDPCASQPLSSKELGELGVYWLDPTSARVSQGNVFVTRLHVRYDEGHFPEDLVLQETADKTNFQGRYVLRHPWTGDEDCQHARDYRAGLAKRRHAEARNLARLTGWRLDAIRQRMAVAGDWSKPEDRTSWWQRLWN